MDPTAASVGQAILGFQNRKENALGKLDKSSAGRIDPRAVDICSAINERSEYYTDKHEYLNTICVNQEPDFELEDFRDYDDCKYWDEDTGIDLP